MNTIIVDESMLIRYYAGETDERETQRVEEWIAASPEHKETAQQIYHIYFACEVLQVMQTTNSQKALAKVNKRIRTVKAAFILRQVQRAAAVLFIPLLCASTYLFVNSFPPEERLIEISTNPGMTTQVTLPDGTKVWLNSETTITYPSAFTGKTREVTLNGEAFFDVKKDAGKTFLVSIKEVKVEVLGTRFNIEAYPHNDNISATLETGKINLIYNPDDDNIRRVSMTPNQKTTVNLRNKSVVTKKVNVESGIAWKEGKIIFNQTSLEDALNILSKHFHVEFIIKNPELKAHSFTGTFTHQRLERILELFNISSGIQSKYITDKENHGEKSVIEIY